MCSPEVSLEWPSHYKSMASIFQTLLENRRLVDCTIAVEGKQLKAHKEILCACSMFFEMLFERECNEEDPYIILCGFSFQEITALIEYMYYGKTKVPADIVDSFINSAKYLQVKGFGERKMAYEESNVSSSSVKNLRLIRKRKRTNGEEYASASAAATNDVSQKLQRNGVSMLQVTGDGADKEQNCNKIDSFSSGNSSVPVDADMSISTEMNLGTARFPHNVNVTVEIAESPKECEILEKDNESEQQVKNSTLSLGDLKKLVQKKLPIVRLQRMSWDFSAGLTTTSQSCLESPASSSTLAESLRTLQSTNRPNNTSCRAVQIMPPTLSTRYPATLRAPVQLPQLSSVDTSPHKRGKIIVRHCYGKPHACLQCSACSIIRKFTNPIKRHTGKRQFICPVCNKGFFKAYELTNHKQIHSEKNPFRCNICGKCFSKINALKLHVDVHATKKLSGPRK